MFIWNRIFPRTDGQAHEPAAAPAPDAAPGQNTSPPTLSELQARFADSPRYTAGRVENIMGWDLEYLDGLSMVSCLDVIVNKGWNDFPAAGPAPVILDCGANIGISVLHYKRKYPQAKIIAFEADPQIAPVLRRNLAINGAGDVQVVEAAVWVEPGECAWLCEGADGSRLIPPEKAAPDAPKVKTVSLADFITQEIDFLKVDIEGAEYEVISSLGDRLDLVKCMVVECHLFNKEVGPLGRLLQTLGDAGFMVAVNSYGVWRDLLRRPQTPPNEFDQYMLVAAWR